MARWLWPEQRGICDPSEVPEHGIRKMLESWYKRHCMHHRLLLCLPVWLSALQLAIPTGTDHQAGKRWKKCQLVPAFGKCAFHAQTDRAGKCAAVANILTTHLGSNLERLQTRRCHTHKHLMQDLWLQQAKGHGM